MQFQGKYHFLYRYGVWLSQSVSPPPVAFNQG